MRPFRLEADLAEMTRQRDAAQDQAQQLQAMYDDAYRSGAEQFDKRRRMRDRIWRVEADLEQALMEKEALEWTVKVIFIECADQKFRHISSVFVCELRFQFKLFESVFVSFSKITHGEFW